MRSHIAANWLIIAQIVPSMWAWKSNVLLD